MKTVSLRALDCLGDPVRGFRSGRRFATSQIWKYVEERLKGCASVRRSFGLGLSVNGLPDPNESMSGISVEGYVQSH